MKISKILSYSCFFFFALLIIRCASPSTSVPGSNSPDANLAAYHTDQYVWEKMVRAFQVETSDPLNLKWELWATTTYAYSDSCSGVAWHTPSHKTALMPPKLKSMLDNINTSPHNFETTDFEYLTLNFDNPYYEELRINKQMFDYIQDNELYNQNKVYKLARAGKINFPQNAMMIKAQWLPVDSSLVGSYYTKVINGKDIASDSITGRVLMGLVGFHLVTHELPNWVWSTFEYAHNKGMCDYIGCKDKFGCVPSYIPPHDSINHRYKSETSDALKALFKKYNTPEVFQNYRLKGSQTEYTDTEGNPTILGNSILEMNLVPSSSCISCHARAALNNTSPDRGNLSMFQDPSTWSFDSTTTGTATKGLHLTCYTGTPVPADYLNANRSGTTSPESIFYQTNFMWQLAQHAKPCENDSMQNQ